MGVNLQPQYATIPEEGEGGTRVAVVVMLVLVLLAVEPVD